MITVFTPTYNRAHLLPRLYESLKAQIFRDFEWIIVDDGSTDNTGEILAPLLQEGLGVAPIRYFKQPNGGKHRAINRGVKEAQGELFFIVDSDDTIPKTSIASIIKTWEEAKHVSNIGGICGYMAHYNGQIIGSKIASYPMMASSLEMRYQYNIKGDMAEVFRTEVLREFPFPEIGNERFCPEALVWNRIAMKYKLFLVDDVIYYRDYLDGGLTSKIVTIRQKSPVATTTHYAELNSYPVPFKDKVKSAINYWRFRACVPKGKQVPKLSWFWAWCQPVGYLMHLRDK